MVALFQLLGRSLIRKNPSDFFDNQSRFPRFVFFQFCDFFSPLGKF